MSNSPIEPRYRVAWHRYPDAVILRGDAVYFTLEEAEKAAKETSSHLDGRNVWVEDQDGNRVAGPDPIRAEVESMRECQLDAALKEMGVDFPAFSQRLDGLIAGATGERIEPPDALTDFEITLAAVKTMGKELGVKLWAEPVKEEAGWVIVKKDPMPLRYMAVLMDPPTGLAWVEDSLQALRFAREKDADDLRLIYGFSDAEAQEHQWG